MMRHTSPPLSRCPAVASQSVLVRPKHATTQLLFQDQHTVNPPCLLAIRVLNPNRARFTTLADSDADVVLAISRVAAAIGPSHELIRPSKKDLRLVLSRVDRGRRRLGRIDLSDARSGSWIETPSAAAGAARVSSVSSASSEPLVGRPTGERRADAVGWGPWRTFRKMFRHGGETSKEMLPMRGAIGACSDWPTAPILLSRLPPAGVRAPSRKAQRSESGVARRPDGSVEAEAQRPQGGPPRARRAQSVAAGDDRRRSQAHG